MRPPRRRERREEDREDVKTRGAKITFNHLQQSEPDNSDDGKPPVVTTDPNRITDR